MEWHNGTGPNNLADSDITVVAKILSVARDYWRYALGHITAHSMKETEVQTEMKKFTGTRYDPAILDILFDTDDVVSDEFMEKPLPIDTLKPGMVLKYNLYNNAHILVLPEGHVFSETTIAKLIHMILKLRPIRHRPDHLYIKIDNIAIFNDLIRITSNFHSPLIKFQRTFFISQKLQQMS